jgi:hypothetical protein
MDAGSGSDPISGDDLVPVGKVKASATASHADDDLIPVGKVAASHTTPSGLAASLGRGAAPYAAGAAIGGALGLAGGPLAPLSVPAGAAAGIGATALTELGGDVYNWLGAPLGHFTTPQEVSDRALDALGIHRPGTPVERGAETVGSLAGSMAGVPFATPVPKPPSAAGSLIKDFESQKVTPIVPTVGQGRTAALAANMATSLPVAGPVVRNAVTQNLAETAEAAERNAATLGTARDATDTGSVVRNALTRFAADKSQAKADYGQFAQTMAGAAPTKMTNTLRVLNDIMGRFPNASGLTGLFTRSPIAKLTEELQPKTVTVPAQLSKTLDQFGNPIVVRQAQTLQRGGALSIDETEELRSQIGYQIEHPTFGPDQIPRGQLKRLYAALTNDMRSAAKAQGPAAERALSKATTNYGIRMRLIERLEPLVSGEAGERSFKTLNSAAQTTGTADSGLLQAAKKVMTTDEWGDFGATIVSRLGEPTPGARDILSGVNFSPSSYVTNWNKLSDRAKYMLFGPNLPDTPRSSLEALARVTQAQKNVGKLANVSRTAEYRIGAVLSLAAADTAWQALTAGRVLPLVGWGAGAGTGYGFAKMLTSPQFARWLYSQPMTSAVTPATVATSAAALVDSLAAPWAKASATGPNGKKIYTDGQHWYNPDQTPFVAPF